MGVTGQLEPKGTSDVNVVILLDFDQSTKAYVPARELLGESKCKEPRKWVHKVEEFTCFEVGVKTIFPLFLIFTPERPSIPRPAISLFFRVVFFSVSVESWKRAQSSKYPSHMFTVLLEWLKTNRCHICIVSVICKVHVSHEWSLL